MLVYEVLQEEVRNVNISRYAKRGWEYVYTACYEVERRSDGLEFGVASLLLGVSNTVSDFARRSSLRRRRSISPKKPEEI